MKLDALQLNPALLAQANTAPKASKDMDMKRIEETAQDFETMFLSEMFRPMFDAIKVDENFGGGKGEEMFRGFLRDEYAKDMAQTGGIGIAELVKDQLIQMQSKASETNMAQNMHGNSEGSTGVKDV